ncbi:hypothetical protein M3Y95_01156000 [Aphelenchoides besseyi]|nr:hypothetical protein M3Y95_01156000 [Aphelenchoides besseyi]
MIEDCLHQIRFLLILIGNLVSSSLVVSCFLLIGNQSAAQGSEFEGQWLVVYLLVARLLSARECKVENCELRSSFRNLVLLSRSILDSEMALACNHKSLLRISYYYYWDILKNFRVTKKRDQHIWSNFRFLPDVQFSWLMKFLNDNQTEVCVTCDSKDHKDDFKVFTWLEDAKDQITGGSKNQAKKIDQNTLVNSSPHYLIHCIIVYAKECPYCKSAREVEDINSLRKQISNLTGQLEASNKELEDRQLQIHQTTKQRNDDAEKIKKLESLVKATKTRCDKKMADLSTINNHIADELKKTKADLNESKKSFDELKKQAEKSDRLKRKAEEERDDETRKIMKLTDGAQELKEHNVEVNKELREEVLTLTAVQKQQSEKITELETTNREALEKISRIQAERDSLFAESLQSGMGLYMFAVQSEKHELKNECVKSLQSKLTMQTAPKLFILSVKCNDEEFTRIVANYAEQNGGKLQLTKSPELKNLLKEDVQLFTRVFQTLTS